MMEVQHLTVRYGSSTLLHDLSFRLLSGDWLILSGPNGAGKSTAIKAIAGDIRASGNVLFEGKDVFRMRPGERAACFGVLSQQNVVAYDFTVEDIVSLGRYRGRKGFLRSHRSPEDEAVIADALEQTELTDFRRRPVQSLSGGELQRVFLAQVFAQQPKVLVLDEPANHLDLVFQKQLFSLIAKWKEQPGKAVISVVHDLSVALKYGTAAILLDRGTCVSYGDPRHVLSPDHLQTVYGMDVHEWMLTLLREWERPFA